jgi:hypothetical protein
MPKNKGGWIEIENLLPFLLIVSRMVGYDFNKVDWKAIQFGMSGSDTERNIWFDYELVIAIATNNSLRYLFAGNLLLNNSLFELSARY